MTAFFCSPLRKLRPGHAYAGNASYRLYLAGNQHAACQAVIESAHDGPLTVRCEGYEDTGLLLEVFEERFVRCGEEGWFPDPLVFVDGPCRHRTRTVLYIRAFAPANTRPGEYAGQVRIRCGAAEAVLALQIRVWAFSLPQTPSCKTAFGLERQWIAALHGAAPQSDACQKLYERYYEALLQHKISAYRMPYPIDDPRSHAYMDDPRVVSFQIDELRVPYSTRRLRGLLEILRTRESWFRKGFFYPIDEPKTKQDYQELQRLARRLRAIEPRYRLVLPHYGPPKDGCFESAYDGMLGKVTIWCPESCLFDDANYWKEPPKERDASLKEKLSARKNAGEEIWWYVCCGPAEAYCNFFIPMEAVRHRLLFTQQWLMGVQGLLYWGTNWWGEADGTPIHPWEDMATVKNINPALFGDGSLFYNGEDGPVVSLRLEAIRDGIDDFEYLCLAERLFGRERTKALVSRIVTGLTDYTHDPDAVTSFYASLGREIEAHLRQNA